jgi:hypothetical protein
MKTKLRIFTAAFLFAFAPVFAGNAMPIKNSNLEISSQSFCGVTAQQIHDYMKCFGINIISMYQITGSCDVHCTSDVGRFYIVHINNGIIDGYDETDQ